MQVLPFIIKYHIIKIKNKKFKKINIIKRRVRGKPKNYFKGEWWDAINHVNVSDPTTREGKKFRLRFRVPFPLFEQLVSMAEELGFKRRPKLASGIDGVPLEIKVLGVLRILGRSTCFDGIEEITGVSAETHRTFFHQFNALFVARYYTQVGLYIIL